MIPTKIDLSHNEAPCFVSVLVVPVLVSGMPGVLSNAVSGEFSAWGVFVRSVPSIPPTARVIKIWDSKIRKIEAGSFSNTNLTEIKLLNNQIGVIQTGALNGLNNLAQFKMWNTTISVIETGAFRGLDNLRTVKMWNNTVSTIKTLAFSGFSNLSEITIWNNVIGTIERRGITWSNPLTRIRSWDNIIENCEEFACIGIYKDQTSGIIRKHILFNLP